MIGLSGTNNGSQGVKFRGRGSEINAILDKYTPLTVLIFTLLILTLLFASTMPVETIENPHQYVMTKVLSDANFTSGECKWSGNTPNAIDVIYGRTLRKVLGRRESKLMYHKDDNQMFIVYALNNLIEGTTSDNEYEYIVHPSRTLYVNNIDNDANTTSSGDDDDDDDQNTAIEKENRFVISLPTIKKSTLMSSYEMKLVNGKEYTTSGDSSNVIYFIIDGDDSTRLDFHSHIMMLLTNVNGKTIHLNTTGKERLYICWDVKDNQ